MVDLPEKSLQQYAAIVGDKILGEIGQLASYLRGARVQHINSTAQGGGVAELLAMLVPLMRDAGLDATWDVMQGSEPFFEVTKLLHNNLHGGHQPLTPEMRKIYWDTTQQNAGLVRRDADFVCIHDPQPVGLVRERGDRERGNKERWVWRCHIDLADADSASWSFLRPLVERFDGGIFHLPDYARELSIPQFICPPAIDPLGAKNCELDRAEIDGVLEKHGLDPKLPIVLQVSRYDRLKDPVGVIQGFKLAARSHPCQLVLVGAEVRDDPESAAVLSEVREAAGADPNIHLLLMERDAPREVNALQRAATVVVQKSVKEGFGLTVTEAMWKAKPVIGGAVGGIRRQIIQGVTGYLVHSPEGLAYRIRQLLGNPGLARQLGESAKQFVIETYMPTAYLRQWLLALLALRYGTEAPVVALG
jgi:trehalose synthase